MIQKQIFCVNFRTTFELIEKIGVDIFQPLNGVLDLTVVKMWEEVMNKCHTCVKEHKND